jgi:hypothetical protein
MRWLDLPCESFGPALPLRPRGAVLLSELKFGGCEDDGSIFGFSSSSDYQYAEGRACVTVSLKRRFGLKILPERQSLVRVLSLVYDVMCRNGEMDD